MEIRTVIADDEPLARSKLRLLLKQEADVRVVVECSDGQQTVEAVRNHRPDLLLLDIEMPRAGGFEVLQALGPEEMPVVIFTTAYDAYAVRAFEAHALDYLLKPFDQERLHRAMERAREHITLHRGAAAERIRAFLSQVASRKGMGERIAIKSVGRVVYVDASEIDWIEAAANYVHVHAGKDVHTMRESISHLAEKLDSARFVRVHRSVIVNVAKIRELQHCNSGEYIVVLRNGKELSCSRSYRSALDAALSAPGAASERKSPS
jgi:two-component system LytT family response regulator